jgi:predicted DNA-binding transcriptional regulator AlpA
MSQTTATRPKPGRFGRPIGWVEAEIDAFVLNMIRAARGQPPLPPPDPADHPAIIREREVLRRTGISRVSRWKMEKAGRFPRRVQLHGFATESADAAQ